MANKQTPRPAPKPAGIHGGKPANVQHTNVMPIPCDANASSGTGCNAPKKPLDRTIRPKRVPYINPYVNKEKEG